MNRRQNRMLNGLSSHKGRRVGKQFLKMVAVTLFASIWSRAQNSELPKAPETRVLALTPVPGYFTEPAIAVNPGNPQQVVAVFQDNAHAAYSQDAGHSWQVADGVEPPNYRVSGDVSTAFDNHGNAFICYMAFDRLGTFNYWGHNSSRNGLFVAARSMEGRPGSPTTFRSSNTQPNRACRGRTNLILCQTPRKKVRTPATFMWVGRDGR